MHVYACMVVYDTYGMVRYGLVRQDNVLGIK